MKPDTFKRIQFNTPERRNQILKLITDKESVTVEYLSKKFNVSLVTVRKDLKSLEEKGLLYRSYGGAHVRHVVALDTRFSEKQKINSAAKQRIGKAAADMIYDGETIILDSGTTTLEIAKNLERKKSLTVLTTSLIIARELAGNPEIVVLLTGGWLREQSYSLSGPFAENMVRQLFFDKIFFSADGFDFQTGFASPNLLESKLTSIMIERSKEIIAVIDSTKFGKKSFATIVLPDKIDCLITDKALQSKYYNKLKKMNIKLTLV